MAESGSTIRQGQDSGPGGKTAQDIINARKEKLEEAKGAVALADREDATPEEALKKAERYAERKAKIAQILSQGVVSFAMRVEDADPGKRYVWVRDRTEDISRMRALGYRLETEAGEGMHGTADDKRRVGDTILMSISREDYEIIKEVENEQKLKKVDQPVRSYLKDSREGAAKGVAVKPIDMLNEE